MASPASSDEGEIRDGNVEKATTSQPQFDGTSVDRPDRNRSSKSSSMSPEHEHRPRDRRSRDRSRSPYSNRPPRGFKRAREDEYPDRSRGDPRRFKVHYEDHSQDYKRRSRVSYEDLDRSLAPSNDLRYDERDRYPEKRSRTRSTSPYRASHGGDRNHRGGQHRREDYRHDGYNSRRPMSHYQSSRREMQDLSVSKRGSPLPADTARQEAKYTQGYSQQHNDKTSSSYESNWYAVSCLRLHRF